MAQTGLAKGECRLRPRAECFLRFGPLEGEAADKPGDSTKRASLKYRYSTCRAEMPLGCAFPTPEGGRYLAEVR
jgi:hypothetical protein